LQRAKQPSPGPNYIHRRFSSPSRKPPSWDALLPAASLRQEQESDNHEYSI